MLLEIFVFLILGILAGTFTGLVPGIHINLVGALLISGSNSSLSAVSSTYLVVFIVSMAITHTFLDFIPSIFLGAPEDGTELSVLPGHELLKLGRGYAAVMLSAYGGLFAVIVSILISYPLILLAKSVYPLLQNIMAFVLIGVSLIMILSETQKTKSLLVYFLSGVLGLIILNLEKLHDPLLPLLAGLFGASGLIISIRTKTRIPKQDFKEEKINSFKPLAGALVASPLCGFLPGLGSGQAAILGNTLIKNDRKGFLVLLGATNTLVMIFSFLSLYAISKTRTGAAAAVKELLGTLEGKMLLLILVVVLFSGVFAFYLTEKFSRIFAKNINKIDYTKLSIITLIVLTMVVFLITGILGLISFVLATFTGIYCILLGVRRTQMMGCLLLPTIIIYLT